LASLGHPCKCQRVSRLGSVTARHCSSGHQPNFVALNKGRHLYSTGRPSRWALAHILVILLSFIGICTFVSQNKFDLKFQQYLLFIYSRLMQHGSPVYFCPVVSSSIYLSSSICSSPNLSRHRLDVYHTSTHGAALV